MLIFPVNPYSLSLHFSTQNTQCINLHTKKKYNENVYPAKVFYLGQTLSPVSASVIIIALVGQD